MTQRRLMYKAELVTMIGSAYSTIWKWMREERFPRSVSVGGKAAWYSDEIEAWINSLPRRRLKGDPPSLS